MDKTLNALLIFLFGFFSLSLEVVAKPFDIQILPIGKEVTLLTPATTNIPLAHKVVLGPTDTPQTLSFKSKAKAGHRPKLMLVKILKGETLLKEVVIKPYETVLYPFTKLEAVTVHTELKKQPKTVSNPTYYLQVSSTKPLSVAH